MSDPIDRQMAIDAILHNQEVYSNNFGNDPIDRYTIAIIDADVQAIAQLPSAQPERKKGKWIERNPQNSDKCRLIECDQCGFSHIVGFNVPYEHWIENRNFCERCGADMREDLHD